MNRSRGAFVLVAALLAVLLPVEQAHCLWMGLEKRTPVTAAVAAPMSPDHACCEASAHHRASPRKSPAACCCIQLPPGSLPSGLASNANTLTTALAAVSSASTLASNALLLAPAPALDVGSPPLPIDPRAHGLRAPPLSA